MGDHEHEASQLHNVHEKSQRLNSYNGARIRSYASKADAASHSRREGSDDNGRGDHTHRFKDESPPPAGLSSDRCLNDFQTRKNSIYHSDVTKFRDDGRKIASNNSSSGAACKGSGDYKLSKMKIFHQGKAYCVYGDEEEARLRHEKLDDRDSTGRNQLHEIRMRNQSHFNIFNYQTTPKRETETVEDSQANPEVSSDCDEHYRRAKSARRSQSPEEPPKRHGKRSNSSSTSCTSPQAPENNHKWQLVTLGLGRISSDAMESQIEKIVRACNVNVVSVHLDRNIINHTCKGTGSVSFRHNGGTEGLEMVQSLLQKSGIVSTVTKVI
ncbi:hypothetical protein BdWA1_000931 [Babesia duncani]|uniref:Uncharacterized protein n=1 Tax=Babesia duncani TaxID=323732 RepID=A0AAD9PNB2_9APIC|nr:hypothetical protein BdWA1_000931 [Babesia duncani]